LVWLGAPRYDLWFLPLGRILIIYLFFDEQKTKSISNKNKF
jgi:hypothetical protein